MANNKIKDDESDLDVSLLSVGTDPSETSLWDVAFDQLSAADQATLGFAEGAPAPSPSKLVQSVEETKQECRQKQWKLFTSKSGEMFTVQDVLDNIIVWVNKFKEVGDVAVQYDTAHAALPWAVIRFFLQMAVNDCDTYGNMLQAVEKVTNIVATYTELETRVLLRRSVLARQLSAALLKLYKDVLHFLAEAHKYYKQHTIRRRVKAALKGPMSIVDAPILSIEQHENTVFRLCSLVQNECTGNSLTDINDLLIHNSKLQSKRTLEDRRAQLLAWVNGVDTRNTFEGALKYRQDGTCNWVLELEEMQAWRSTSIPPKAKLFWLHGPPGFGKTIACAWTIQDLNKSNPDCTAYFFCVAENRLTQDPYAILRSWIAQLMSQNAKVVTLVESIFSQRTGKDQTLSQLELWQLFVTIGQSGLGFALVVDGFDECTHINSKTKYHTTDPRNIFLKELVTHLAKTDFRVLVVSRDIADIRDCLQPDVSHSDNLEAFDYGITARDTGADVTAFSENMVNKALPNKVPGLRESLAKTAATRSEGMFLWIKLLESEISSGQNAWELQQTITEMPAGISEAYSRELERIIKLNERPRSAALAILRWVLFAVRPLQVKELAEALAISNMRDDETAYPRKRLPDAWEEGFVDEEYVDEMILGRCGSLIHLRSNKADESLADRTVHFVHFSVKEYLLSLQDAKYLFGTSGRVQVAEEETHLAHICLRYLTLPVFADSLTDKAAYPFLSYAAWAWYFHSWYKQNMEVVAETVARTKRVFHPHTGSWKVWSPMMNLKLNDDQWKLTVPIDDTSESSEEEVEDAGTHKSPPTMSLSLQNPLYYASLLGIEEIVKWLEDEGLNCNCKGGLYGFPLQAAVVGKHVAVVRHLINRSADVNSKGGHFTTALMAAASVATPEITNILIAAGADVSVTNRGGCTALHAAAERGNVDIINALLGAGASIDLQAGEVCSGCSPVHYACIEGHKEAVKVLKSWGADMELRDSKHRRAIWLAVVNGHEELACDLLDMGVSTADYEDEDSPVSAPLLILAAYAMEGTKFIKKLLESGLDANRKWGGWTALHEAAARDTPDALRILIDAGGDLTQCSDDGMTPISVSAAHGKIKTLKYMLEHMVKSERVAFWGKQSPLWAATVGGHGEIVKLLLDSGMSIHWICEDDQETLFDTALLNGHHDIARLIVERGGFREVGHMDSRPGSLACILFAGDMETAEQLLATSTSQAYTKSEYSEALRVASTRGWLSIAKLLIARGARAGDQDGNGRTSSHHAVAHGHLDLAGFLVEKSASWTVRDTVGSTPIDLAIRQGQESLDFIRQHMADLSMVINRRPSLLLTKEKREVTMRPSEIRQAITGEWSGHSEHLSWEKGHRVSTSIHIGATSSDDNESAKHQSAESMTTASLEFFNRDEEDKSGMFHFYGFVDPVGVIWWVKLYDKWGWLYKGKLDTTTRTIRGTWGSNPSLWHGTFELRQTVMAE
ncbi:ankyrin repeat and SOCS box protein 7 [Xylaria telfairii]|nr:ankyrin repeat and SOCS box protein 7 [Xylaria telfairii]